MNTDDVDAIYDELNPLYGDISRFYHGWDHLIFCFWEFDRAVSEMDCPDAVELALWFHDAIFVPQATDNEQRSADLFTRLSKGYLPDPLVEKVCRLILITSHRMQPSEVDECFVADIDLSGFGLPWPEYMTDTVNIRRELNNVTDAVFYPQHTRFLTMLLSRPSIFYTSFFRERYEEPARQNIQRLLSTKKYTREMFEC